MSAEDVLHDLMDGPPVRRWHDAPVQDGLLAVFHGRRPRPKFTAAMGSILPIAPPPVGAPIRLGNDGGLWRRTLHVLGPNSGAPLVSGYLVGLMGFMVAFGIGLTLINVVAR